MRQAVATFWAQWYGFGGKPFSARRLNDLGTKGQVHSFLAHHPPNVTILPEPTEKSDPMFKNESASKEGPLTFRTEGQEHEGCHSHVFCTPMSGVAWQSGAGVP